MAPPGELRVKAGMVCWQVKLCDPHLSALEVRFSRRGAIQIDYRYLFTFTVRCCVLKEPDHGGATDDTTASAGAAIRYSGTNSVAVGQLIDFDTDTATSRPAAAMANLCMFVIAQDFCWLSQQFVVV